jgi:RimJ/RimL family protein N-acetyltransferase
MVSEHWPLFDLEIHTPTLTLRNLDDELTADLIAVARGGIHDPAVMPFVVPWTDLPSPQMEQEAMRFYARTRAEVRPAAWNLQFAVIVDGKVVGACDLIAESFPQLRHFKTGSWLGLEFQGRGFGKELRQAALALGFGGFGAEFALTGMWHDNAASKGVTTSLGYEYEGRRRALRRGVPDESLSYRMARAHWETIRRDDIELVGVDSAREFLGI